MNSAARWAPDLRLVEPAPAPETGAAEEGIAAPRGSAAQGGTAGQGGSAVQGGSAALGGSAAEEESAPREAMAVAEYLGPGRVVEARPGAVEVEIGGGERAVAQMALAYPYAPVVSDVLLVIGRGGEYYVIGVLHGTGRATLAFSGGVELRAEGGPLTLSSDRGVAIRGPEMEVETGKLRMIAGSVAQKFGSLYQRVRESLSVHAGQAQTIVEERSSLTAKNASIVTEETMTINGSEIHLG